MNSCNLLTVGSLFYSILLMIVFFTKRRLSSIENRVYGALIISNFIGVVIAIACYITVSNYETLAEHKSLISFKAASLSLTYSFLKTIYAFGTTPCS